MKLDQLDLKIIHALQVQPRASWSLIGSCVGVDPATATRRWQRLTEAGAAWISCFPILDPTDVGAILELQCEPGRTQEVASILAGDPHARTVQIQSGEFDIGIVLFTRTTRDLSRYVLERLALVGGIKAVRTLPITGSYRDITRWRVRALDPATVQRLTAGSPLIPRRSAASDWEVIAALSQNPRISVGELASQLSVSPSTARRRLEAAASRQVQLMCELAVPLSPWTTQVTMWADCRPDKLVAVATELSRLPDIVAIFTTLGRANLDVAVRFRSIRDVERLAAAITLRLPDIQIVDRVLVMRLVKWGGQVLDKDGFAVNYVPIDIRQDPVPRSQPQSDAP
jgi:DNA-binding Lrp family transcriptional regulator